MKTTIRTIFRDERQFRLFLVMSLSSLFGVALIAIRMYYADIDLTKIRTAEDFVQIRGGVSFLFLVWNLFLAWIPYWIALNINRVTKLTDSKLAMGSMLAAWLLFFPNAPYIVTDLLHLKSRSPIPLWYDMMVLVTFAWTGLMLGFLSLYEVQQFLQKRLSAKLVWALITAAIFLGSFGVYLGRFLRWNSWDVIMRPATLAEAIILNFSDPAGYASTFNITAVFSIFLLLAYLVLVTLMGETNRRFENNG